MHISQYSRCLTLKQALDRIRANNTVSFEWYPVDNGLCKFELGGTSKAIKAYVPHVENGEIVVLPNQHVDTRFDLMYDERDGEGHCSVNLSTANGQWKKTTREAFIKILRTDLTKIKVEVRGWVEEVIHPYAVADL